MSEVPGVVLAGGLARRMGGGDKALLLLDGQPILSGVIERLKPQAYPIAINANGDPSRFEAFGLQVLADDIPGHPGPLAGVLAGLEWAAGLGADAIVTVAADTPFFPVSLVSALQEAARAEGTKISLAATFDFGTDRVIRHPTFGLWPTRLRHDLRTALQDGVRKVVQWTDKHGAASAIFSSEVLDPFFNINTPDDLEKAAALAGAT